LEIGKLHYLFEDYVLDYLTSIRVAAASKALAGKHAEAREAVARLRELDPAMCIANVRDWATLRGPETLQDLRTAYEKPADLKRD
jgi:hypothetical protein